MKILVTSFSQTGNTAKIGQAIYDVVSQGNNAELKKMEDVDAGVVAEYDLIFVGSPLHAANLSAQAKTFLAGLQPGACSQLAGFITHSGPAYPAQDMEGFVEPLTAACKEKGIEYKGSFSCQGYLTEAIHDMVKQSQNATDEQWAETVKQMSGHPDEKDVANAMEFARGVLGS